MKATCLLVACVLISFGAIAAPVAPTIIARAPHHRVWQTVTEEMSPSGEVVQRVGSYVDMETGMHVLQENGIWTEASGSIELENGFGVARRAQHSVIFSPNINTPGAIDVLAPDGKRFRSAPIGLAYFSCTTGESIWIAEIKDSIGETQPNGNQIVYPDAFAGENVKADIRFTNRKGSLECDVILRQRILPPAHYGLEGSCQLQVWHEFVEVPAGTRRKYFIRQEADPAVRQAMFEPDFSDESWEFGQFHLVQGKAFLIENDAIVQAGIDMEKEVPVGKTLTTIRDPETQLDKLCLIETVEYSAVEPLLQTLPVAAANLQPFGVPSRPGEDGPQKAVARAVPSAPSQHNLNRQFGAAATVGRDVLIAPSARKPVSSRAQSVASLKKNPRPRGKSTEHIQLAKAPMSGQGVVLDWIILNSGTNNYVFGSSITTYISGQVTLGGTNIIEPGTIIKFSPTNSAQLYITGSGAKIVSQATQYRAAILTARDDATVGEPITQNSPSGYYATYGIYINYYGGASIATLNNLQVRYANTGIYFAYGTGHTLSHVQFVNCFTAVGCTAADFNCRNVLGYGCYTMFNGFAGITHCENATFNNGNSLSSGFSSVYLTNCVLAGISSVGSYSGANNAIESSSS